MHLDTHGIILNKALGKQCWRLQAITPESGLITCFQHQSKKMGKAVSPDLFDSAALLLKSARSGTTRFVEEYHLLQRRTSLATHYKNFLWATRFAKILLKNPLHSEATEELYMLTQTALGHWEKNKQGAAIYLKALYRLILLEGLPIKEDWIPRLPKEERKILLTLLNNPINSIPETDESIHKGLTSSLEQWMGQHTEIHC